jgi:hypothetical protein
MLITEKAISDYAWCPTLFQELDGNSKRFKSPRDKSADFFDFLRSALATRVSNSKVYVDPTTSKAVPYQGDFWVVLDSGENQLLMVFAEAFLKRLPDGVLQVCLVRKQRRKRPRAEDSLKAEEFVRCLFARTIQQLFADSSVLVATQYQDGVEDITLDPSSVDLEQADAYVETIRAAVEGEISLEAKTYRCRYCWWRHECSRASAPTQASNTPSSGPRLDIL